ncbi:hypothetical protein SUGI_0860080 [Cryptomeria japonica]|nr:hypothetical protein SUGI_0860080 [Cryptomeria japonica]
MTVTLDSQMSAARQTERKRNNREVGPETLKACTNGWYRSAEHRVVCKGCRDRMSIALFTSFPEETEIWAPEELVDDNNPRHYKPLILSHLIGHKMRNSEENAKTTALERFASI